MSYAIHSILAQMPHFLHAPFHYLCFQNPNRRSDPLNMISILRSAWRLIFIFFENFLLYFYTGTKSEDSGPSKNSDFVLI